MYSSRWGFEPMSNGGAEYSIDGFSAMIVVIRSH